MPLAKEQVRDALYQLIAELGHDGGVISPSIYDTAQVLRFAPPPSDTRPALAWLMRQQQVDGGWGDPSAPLARDIPTLAAMIALTQCGQGLASSDTIDRGLQFLAANADHWRDADIDLLPIAAETTLPRLISDARGIGLPVQSAHYGLIDQMAARKRKHLDAVQIAAGSAPSYSWEALGRPFDPALPGPEGSIGHSPAATAYWLHQAARADLQPTEHVHRAREYLARAGAATASDVPGVVPTVWPLPVFEYIYALLAFVQNGLHREPDFVSRLAPHVATVTALLERDAGLSFSGSFVADVDCTAVGASAIAAFGAAFDPGVVEQFRRGDRYVTYAGELNPSTFSNAHALHALGHAGIRHPSIETFLIDRASAEGGWRADKWHSSWIYTSLEVAMALQETQIDCLRRVTSRLADAQETTGAWRRGHTPSGLETTYAVMLLRLVQRACGLNPREVQALDRAEAWLVQHATDNLNADERLWMGKELYAPRRVDRAYQLSTLWAIQREHNHAA